MAGNKNSGRKKTSPTTHASAAVSVHLTAEAKDLITRAAKSVNIPAGRWLGNVGIKEARQMLGIVAGK
jgi:uncharacterized protein (DUF1778 family)